MTISTRAFILFVIAAGCDGTPPMRGTVVVYSGPDLTSSAYPAHVPRAVSIGDLDGDGRPDMVTAGDQSPPVTVLLAAGDLAPITYDGPAAADVATADMDGDGRLDVVTGYSGSVSVYRNLGGGVLDAPQSYAAGGQRLAVADFDGDGHPDVASASFGSLTVMVDRGGVLVTTQGVSPRMGPLDLAAADVNEDGAPDLVTTDCAFGLPQPPCDTFSVLLGNGDGTFAAAVPVQVGPWAYHLRLADFDGDGHIDVVVQQATAIDVFKGAGDGTFAVARTTELTFRTGVFGAIDLGPCTANDCPLFVADTTLDSLQLADPTSVPVTRAGTMNLTFPSQIRVADLDGDGVPDVIAADGYGP